jgi:hypothetical protein
MRTIAALTLSLLVASALFAQSPRDSTVKPKADTLKKEVPAQKSNLSISRALIALDVKDLEPENIGDTFPSEVRRLFCFTQIKGASGPEEIQHRWYWGDELMGTVSLKVNSGNFRTYSSKSIPLGLQGDWRVYIVDSKDESIIGTVKFITQ